MRRDRAVPRPLAAVLLLAAFLAACGGQGGEPTADTAGAGDTAEGQTIELYFPGDGGMIYPERRLLSLPDVPEDKVRLLVDTLLEGPRHRGDVVALFPMPVVTGEIYISTSGTAFIDLRRAEPEGEAEGEEEGDKEPAAPMEAPSWSMGSTEELQIVMSLVNTVVYNVPEVERVALLWEGVQPETFAGHVDTTRPLAADRSLVSR